MKKSINIISHPAIQYAFMMIDADFGNTPEISYKIPQEKWGQKLQTIEDCLELLDTTELRNFIFSDSPARNEYMQDAYDFLQDFMNDWSKNVNS